MLYLALLFLAIAISRSPAACQATQGYRVATDLLVWDARYWGRCKVHGAGPKQWLATKWFLSLGNGVLLTREDTILLSILIVIRTGKSFYPGALSWKTKQDHFLFFLSEQEEVPAGFIAWSGDQQFSGDELRERVISQD